MVDTHARTRRPYRTGAIMTTTLRLRLYAPNVWRRGSADSPSCADGYVSVLSVFLAFALARPNVSQRRFSAKTVERRRYAAPTDDRRDRQSSESRSYPNHYRKNTRPRRFFERLRAAEVFNHAFRAFGRPRLATAVIELFRSRVRSAVGGFEANSEIITVPSRVSLHAHSAQADEGFSSLFRR